MPNTSRIQFKVAINASREKVWQVMLGEQSFPRWTSPFIEGSHFEGSWKQGSRIKFLSPSGDGMISEIAENRPHEFVSIRHIGIIVKGVEDTESEAAQAMTPAYENYSFAALGQGTELTIEQDVTPDFEQSMKDAWPKALEMLKQMCER